MSATGPPAKGQPQKKETQNGTNNKKPKSIKDEKKQVQDAKNKMKFHSTKMDLNLKILREEMVSSFHLIGLLS